MNTTGWTLILKSIAFQTVTGGILFGCAGTLRWPYGWAWLSCILLIQLATVWILAWHSPDLLEERSRLQPGTKSWDKFVCPGMALAGPMLTIVAAGLQRRFHCERWPVWMPAVAVLVTLAGGAVAALAMYVNRFFSTTVRIQSERGHVVVSGGPYRVVRHPGYVGMLLVYAAIPFALGSRWALALAALTVILVVVRTALEDGTLRADLPGYAEYAGKVRYRLLPGVW
ncbi:MAG: isoprenylcysteine carboxylmethyltransferase family protein [Bryobacteraceae bacterium]|jgi:protein-S-isoprenylcysteine O-methyltransferase Ste14